MRQETKESVKYTVMWKGKKLTLNIRKSTLDFCGIASVKFISIDVLANFHFSPESIIHKSS